LAAIAGVILMISPKGGPSYFINRSAQSISLRGENLNTFPWKYSFQVELPLSGSKNGFIYPIPKDDITQLEGKEITIGAWIWSDQPIQINLPALQAHFHLRAWYPSQLSQSFIHTLRGFQ
jgi:hypothetical protein